MQGDYLIITYVELEGVEPSSKQGSHMLSPRPNKEAICFLHAYLCLRFSCISKTRATHLYLSP